MVFSIQLLIYRLMSLYNPTKFNRNSKLAQKSALAKALLEEVNSANFKIPLKNTDNFTPQKKNTKNKLVSVKDSGKIERRALITDPDPFLFKSSDCQRKSSSPMGSGLRIKTSLANDQALFISSPVACHTARQQRSVQNYSDSKAFLSKDKKSIVLNREETPKQTSSSITKSLRGRSGASVSSERSTQRDLYQRQRFFTKKSDIQHNEYGQFEMYNRSHRQSKNKLNTQQGRKRVMVANIDLSKFTFVRKESDNIQKYNTQAEEGQCQEIYPHTEYGVLKERNITEQLNYQNYPDSNKAEMRKSREVYRTNFNMSYGHPQKDYRDETIKENMIMPETYVSGIDEKERISTSRVRQVQKVLADKQRDYNRVCLQNQNLASQVRSLNTRLSSLQENYSRMESVAGFSHKTIQDLREEANKLRDELSVCRSNNTREIQQKEKEFRIHFDKVLNQKNETITRLEVFLRQTQKELEACKRNTDSFAKAAKLDEFQKLVEYYRKQNKIIGMELFNTKKNHQQLARQKDIADSELKQLTQQIEILNSTLAYKDQQIIEKDNMLSDKLRQSQHQKNLIYDSLSKSVKNKDDEIFNLRKEISRLKDEPVGLARSLSALEISTKSRISQQQLKACQMLTKQLDQCKLQLNKLSNQLVKQTVDKEKALSEKKILLNALVEKQKRQEQQRRNELAQKQSNLSAKYDELERISNQLTSKTTEISHLTSVIKTMESKYLRTETLLEETNKELLKARIQILARKMNQYY